LRAVRTAVAGTHPGGHLGRGSRRLVCQRRARGTRAGRCRGPHRSRLRGARAGGAVTRSRPRVGLLGFFHESNSFADGAVDELEVGRCRLDGREIIAEHADSGTTIAGYIDAAHEFDWELIPLTYIELVPSAPLTAEAAQLVVEALRASLRQAAELDMIVVAMHGAAVSAHRHDLDGWILRSIREEVGPDVPVGVTLDLHANVSPLMVQHADVLIGYRTNPHIDPRERGREVGALTEALWRDGTRPSTALRRVPALMGILTQGTEAEPWSAFAERAAAWRDTPGVLAVSLFQGFPWADVPETGMSVVVHTDAARPDLDPVEIAADLADLIWASRDDFVRAPAAPAAALASADPRRRTLVLDVGDNIGAGGSGRRTELLSAAIAAGLRSFVCIVCDESAAARAVSAGAGAEVEFSLGEPGLAVRARVLSTSDGRYEDAG